MEDKVEVSEVKEFIYKPLLVVDEAAVAIDANKTINPDFKGEVEQKKVRFPAELGEEHPFDFRITEGIFKKFGMVNGIIDKFVDFVIGPGFHVESDNERAKEIIEQFMLDVNFDTLLRAWLKEGLVKGNGFIEIGGKKDEAPKGLKILNANHMYVDRDDKGVIEGYNQYTGGFKRLDKSKIIPFKPFQIAHLPFNRIGDDAYGMGIISPALSTINSLLQNTKNMNMLMDRKANSPYHVKMGGVHGGKYYKPSPGDVVKMGKDFEWLNNKHEWITDGLTDISILDFGKMGEKFDFALTHDKEMLMFTFQVPAVLMGMANINEGIAKVQMDGFERRVGSIQAEAEKVIENDLFKRVLLANGFDEHVEFVWGRPSSMEKFNRLEKIKEIMGSPLTSESLRRLMEHDVVKLLDYNEEEFVEMLEDEDAEKEREKEELRKQPIVPGQNATPAQRTKPREAQPKPKTTAGYSDSFDDIITRDGDVYDFKVEKKKRRKKGGGRYEQTPNKTSEVNDHWHFFSVDQNGDGETLDTLPDGEAEHTHKIKDNVVKSANGHIHKLIPGEHACSDICEHSVDIKEGDYNNIQEWLGFNYKEYLAEILTVIKGEGFDDLKAKSKIEEEAGRFSDEQLVALRGVLDNGFEKGKNIKQITKDIKNKVKPQDLLKMDAGKIVLGVGGVALVVKGKEQRSLAIARSEITRVANAGAIEHYKKGGVNNIRWVASFGPRTCPNCEALDGRIFTTETIPPLPLHTMCRCTTVPVTEVV